MKRVFLGYGIYCLWTIWLLSQISGPLATHFDLRGVPDDHMSHTGALGFFLLFPLGISVFCLGLFGACKKFPRSSMNVPNAEYWRRPENFGRACEKLMNWGYSFTLLLLAFFGGMVWVTVSSNKVNPPHLIGTSFAFLMAAFFVGLSFQVLALMKSFKSP